MVKRSDLLPLLLGVASAVLFFGSNVLPRFEPADLSEVRWTERYEVRVPIGNGEYRKEIRTRTRCCVPGPMSIMSAAEVAKKRSELKAMGLL